MIFPDSRRLPARAGLSGLIAMLAPVCLAAQFFLNGEAVQLNDTCYQLTEARNNSIGSIWNPDKVDLSVSFEAIVQVYLGCKDADGADGIVFGFQPVSTSIGGFGEGIGFQGIRPSLGIELDTWQNDNLADPPYDHLAITRDGVLDHGSSNTLAGPVRLSSAQDNLEDCDWHELVVSWDAENRELEVYFDCALRLRYSGDLVNDIFGGDPEVFWGFTSATGGANNVHQVCFSYTTFLDRLSDAVVCPGGQVRLRARGGVRYRWSPEAGLSDPRSPTPFAAPRQTTRYTVAIEDECGRTFFDEALVEVAGDSVFFELGPDTVLCEGDQLPVDVTTPTATYQWSDGRTDAARRLAPPGFYEVTVTRTDTFCTASDAIALRQLRRPRLELGPDTVLCDGQSLVLRAGFDGAEVEWQDGSRADTFRVAAPGFYQAILTNRCGIAVDDITVNYEDCRSAYLPNAFSPNGDGVNDQLLLYQDGDVAAIRLFQVFSRWGELLYEARDAPPGDGAAWDGRFRGQAMPQGVYVYVLELEFRDGARERRVGEVHLVR